jgi:hypothetical protein
MANFAMEPLKAKHLRRFKKQVDRFYMTVIEGREYALDVTQKYQKRVTLRALSSRSTSRSTAADSSEAGGLSANSTRTDKKQARSGGCQRDLVLCAA